MAIRYVFNKDTKDNGQQTHALAFSKTICPTIMKN